MSEQKEHVESVFKQTFLTVNSALQDKGDNRSQVRTVLFKPKYKIRPYAWLISKNLLVYIGSRAQAVFRSLSQ
jgi:hypothetical protein